MAKPTSPPRPVQGNFSPVADDEAFSTNEDSPLAITFASLLDGDKDQNQKDVLSVTYFQSFQHCSITGANAPAGSFYFVPDKDFFGTASFEYVVSDGKGGTDVGVVTITVNGINDAPLLSGPVTASAIEDGPVVTLNGLANASDVEGSTLSIVGVPTTLPDGVSFDAATGIFSLDPSHASYQYLNDGSVGSVSVAYGISDGTASTSASVSWAVGGVDEPNIVIDPNSSVVNQLFGTSGEVDYFVFDVSGAGNLDVIHGYETFDRIVLVNAPAHRLTEPSLLSGDYFQYFPNDPGIFDSQVQFYDEFASPQLYATVGLVDVDYRATGVNVQSHRDNPYPEPNVFHTDGNYVQEFWGTAGVADYIVADAQQVMAYANVVYGFEPGLDKISVVNAPATEPHQWSFEEWGGNMGTEDDPNIANTSFIGTYLGGSLFSGLVSLIAIDVAITGSDVVRYADNPFV
jgi:hypothetical protein